MNGLARAAVSPHTRMRLPSRGRSAASSMTSVAFSDDGMSSGDDDGGGGAASRAEHHAESTVLPAHAKLTIRHELDEIDSLLAALRQPAADQWTEDARTAQATNHSLFQRR
jgi:hypothetical protein